MYVIRAENKMIKRLREEWSKMISPGVLETDAERRARRQSNLFEEQCSGKLFLPPATSEQQLAVDRLREEIARLHSELTFREFEAAEVKKPIPWPQGLFVMGPCLGIPSIPEHLPRCASMLDGLCTEDVNPGADNKHGEPTRKQTTMRLMFDYDSHIHGGRRCIALTLTPCSIQLKVSLPNDTVRGASRPGGHCGRGYRTGALPHVSLFPPAALARYMAFVGGNCRPFPHWSFVYRNSQRVLREIFSTFAGLANGFLDQDADYGGHLETEVFPVFARKARVVLRQHRTDRKRMFELAIDAEAEDPEYRSWLEGIDALNPAPWHPPDGETILDPYHPLRVDEKDLLDEGAPLRLIDYDEWKRRRLGYME